MHNLYRLIGIAVIDKNKLLCYSQYEGMQLGVIWTIDTLLKFQFYMPIWCLAQARGYLIQHMK